MRTRICDLLDIKHPILQGGMAWVSDAKLAAAVSDAGGLGIIGTGQAPPEWVETQIKMAKNLTEKPFGVNVMLLSSYTEEVIDIIIREQIPVVTTGAGNPGKYIKGLQEVGTKVIPVVASVALARRLEEAGVDAFIAEGMEAGGHIGDLTTMVLVPQIVDAVEVPVIAAGGIVDGRSAAAAFLLGADGVQLGTRFICAEECTVHPKVKEKILGARDRDTVVTGRSTGLPVRCLRNKLTRQFEEMEARKASPEELKSMGAGKLRAAMVDGEVEYGSVMAGQVAAMVWQVQPAKTIIQDLILDLRENFKQFCSLEE